MLWQVVVETEAGQSLQHVGVELRRRRILHQRARNFDHVRHACLPAVAEDIGTAHFAEVADHAVGHVGAQGGGGGRGRRGGGRREGEGGGGGGEGDLDLLFLETCAMEDRRSCCPPALLAVAVGREQRVSFAVNSNFSAETCDAVSLAMSVNNVLSEREKVVEALAARRCCSSRAGETAELMDRSISVAICAFRFPRAAAKLLRFDVDLKFCGVDTMALPMLSKRLEVVEGSVAALDTASKDVQRALLNEIVLSDL
mmetsp:Transcript_32945/g.104143  ORF Transcript_32945/g.104143 Transcript_32945/m.104143 type:complete len:256 (+) Transcript_32945:517-1284(+)